MIEMNDSAWVAQHPYLKELADFHVVVEETVREVSLGQASIPRWDDYASDFQAGTPLLLSSLVEIDLNPATSTIALCLEKLSLKPLLGDVTKQCQALLPKALDPSCQMVEALLHGESSTSAYSGCLHYLGWTVLASYLAPVVEAFSKWRNEDDWLLNYCPICGALPAMGQLVEADTGRVRLLRCGRCKCRWLYRRTACPFCQNADDHRLATLSVRNEPFRIEYCEGCRGYLKTYVGEGNENCLLADWTSLHLDVVAQDRGLKRCGRSLYEI
jgi:FdhE protein